MNIKEIIDHLDELEKFDVESEENRQALREAIALLRTHQDNQPNEPLTLEELREMAGRPVWVQFQFEGAPNGWCLVHRATAGGCVVIAKDRQLYGILSEEMKKHHFFYRRPPKEEA